MLETPLVIVYSIVEGVLVTLIIHMVKFHES